MKTICIVLLTTLCAIGLLHAQGESFTVILNKGENTIQQDGQWSRVPVGVVISGHDAVRIVKDGYMAVLHSSGVSLELSTEGEYSLDKLSQKLAEHDQSLAAKYGKYLANRLNSDEQNNKNMQVTGAVERSAGGIIQLLLPNSGSVFGNHLPLSWSTTEGNGPYLVTVKNVYDEEIAQKETADGQIVLDLQEPSLQDQKLLIVHVKAKGNEHLRSGDYGIKPLTPEEKSNVTNDLQPLMLLANEETLMGQLLLASFFEEHNLLIDAINHYEKALAKAPDTNGVDVLYKNFLMRNGLNK
jgi:hypothetical protein